MLRWIPLKALAFVLLFGLFSATLAVAQGEDDFPPGWSAGGAGGANQPPVERITISPASIQFDSLRVGEVSQESSFTVTNVSGQTLTIQDLALKGTDKADFQVTTGVPGGGTTLTPGQSATFGVTWSAPSERGVSRAKLLVELGLGLYLPNEALTVAGSAVGQIGSEVLLNAGGALHLDSGGETWSADYGFRRGLERTIGEIVAGTSEQALYQTRRRGMNQVDFSYRFGLRDAGVYEVTLLFAEVTYQEAGKRTFDVLAEDALVLDDYDVFAAAGGQLIAHEETFRVEVTDGLLNLEFLGVMFWPDVQGIAVRGVPNLISDQPVLDFGAVSSGDSSTVALDLTNNGVATATIDTVSLLLNAAGTPEAFSILLDGQTFQGTSGNAVLSTSISLTPGETKTAMVTFAPTEERYDAIQLGFAGDFGSLPVTASGLGGHEGDPYLHVVIVAPEVAVDYDGGGDQDIVLDGTSSHTHEPGQSLIAWEWQEGGMVLDSLPLLLNTATLGSHSFDLTISDDGAPQRNLTGSWGVQVVSSVEVPGVWTRYYDAAGGSASVLIGSLPGIQDWAESSTGFNLSTGSAVGGSPFVQDVAVQFVGDVELDTAGDYTFIATGGAAHRIYLGGLPVFGTVPLVPGSYPLEVRFAVDSLADLPLDVSFSLDGGPAQPFDTATTVHDESGLLPFINSMPDVGTTAGGNLITIDGFGLFPTANVTVNWGGLVFDSSDFVTNREPDQIELLSPPGTGSFSVTVTTPNGTSNAMPFVYDSGGPVPIVFDIEKTYSGIPQGTAAVWGPDGHLYLASLDGRITELVFDDAWGLTALTVHPGISGQSNPNILGIAINPYDPPTPVRLYLSHGEHFLNGGSSFTGPSDYTGEITTIDGPNFDTPVPVVTGLPTSNHDHGMNGIAFDNNGDLLIAMGSNTNAGVKHPNSGDVPESPLSAAVLKAHLSRPGFDGAVSYADSVGGAANNDQVFGESVDQVGGFDVELFASGLRNPYGLVYTTDRRLFVSDNGPNIGFGAASTSASTEAMDPYDVDEINRVEWGNYYGSPNRSRGRFDDRQNIYMPSTTGDDIPGTFSQVVTSVPSSADGMIEYTASTFQGQMRGDLLVQQWNAQIQRIELDAAGRTVTSVSSLATLAGLALVQGPGGAVLSLDYTSSRLRILVPDDISVSGLTVYDIFPWRAPASGGAPFVIGGEGFGDLSDTTVTIGGLPAALTRVSSNRIEGIVPVNASPTTTLESVVVTVDVTSFVFTSAFRFLLPIGTEPGQWEGLPDVPTALGEVTAAEINGLLYVLGEGSAQTFVFDLINQVWLPNAAARPLPGHHHAAEVVGAKLYLIGGLGDSSEGTVQIFDPALNSWSMGAVMPRDVGSVSTAAIDGLIYAAGGIVTAGFTVEDAAVYDPVADLWTVLADMPDKRNHTASATDGEKLYLFGGRAGGNFVTNGFDETQVYDPVTGLWESSSDMGSTLLPLPEARGGMGKAIFYRGEFYVFGGETVNDPDAVAGNVYDRVDVYNPVTNTWRLEAPMPTPRHGIFPVLFQGRMFLAGGGVIAANSQSVTFDEFTRQ